MKFAQQTAASPNVAQGVTSTGVAGPMVQGVVSDTPPSYVDGYVQPVSISSEGRLRVATEPPKLDFFSLAGQVPEINAGSMKNPWGF